MVDFFYTTLYTPIYNLLILLTDFVPGQDIGVAVILATIIVKIIISPLSFSALRTARAVKVIEPELKNIRETYKDDRETQAKEMFALYKKYRINPFAGFLSLLIQLPIVITLYWVFNNKELLTVDPNLLYSFVGSPTAMSHYFLGIFLVTGSSIILSLVAGVVQYLQAVYTIPVPEKEEKPSMQADLGRAIALQMRFILPLFVAIAAYFTSVAIALYFITSSVVSIVQEFFVRRSPLPTPDA